MARAIPVIGVARFNECLLLIERLLEQSTDTFLSAQARYADKHALATTRGLDAGEAVQLVTVLGDAMSNPQQFADASLKMQQDGPRVTQRPAQMEMLLAAGLATAPQFFTACLRLVALIEMPKDVFRQAREDGELAAALETAHAKLLDDDESMDVTRARVIVALGAFAEAGGRPPGEGVRLLGQTIWQAIQQAMLLTGSEESWSRSIVSADSTEDGPPDMSSTTSPTQTASST